MADDDERKRKTACIFDVKSILGQFIVPYTYCTDVWSHSFCEISEWLLLKGTLSVLLLIMSTRTV
jgi:hypothetical protein